MLVENAGKGLDVFVSEELMPEAVQNTVQAHLRNYPQEAWDYELGRIKRAVMRMFVDDDGEAMEFQMAFNGLS